MSYQLIKKGKIRSLYLDHKDPNNLLIKTSNNVSIYNVVLPFTIPFKGIVLTNITRYWSEVLNNLVATAILPSNSLEKDTLLYKKLEMFNLEFVVRSYVNKKREKEILSSGSIDGIPVASNIVQEEHYSRFLTPIITYYIKGEDYDQPIAFEQLTQYIEESDLEKISEISLDIFAVASKIYREKGFILMDTKFEFGKHENKLYLADEILTPDSSRLLSLNNQLEHFDKEFLRFHYKDIDASEYKSYIPNKSVLKELIRRYQSVENALLS